MADKTITVDLAAYVSDLDSDSLKDVAPAPIARRIEDMLDLVHASCRKLGEVSPTELLCALVQTTDKDGSDLANRVGIYRDARVWETLEMKKKTGSHTITLPGPGRRKR